MSIKIALAGNPNTGKTTLFNALTGSDQYVGNWPGVTVEKKEGILKGHKDVVIQDLPGIYSLSPYSLEEKVSRRFLVDEKPGAIFNIVDGTNLERNLYFTTQLAELGLPMMVAVNMMDVVKKNGDTIDFSVIGKELHCEVVGISAAKGEGCVEAAETLLAKIDKHGDPEVPHVFTGSVEHAIAHIEESIQTLVPKHAIRWFAIKLFERDRDVIANLKLEVGLLKHIEQHIRDCEKELDDDAESIITNQRYAFAKKLVDQALNKSKKSDSGETLSDKIDRFVTHPILALPVFVAAISAMWFLAVAENGPGTLMTDWANDGLLGEDGWFLPFTEKEGTGEGYVEFQTAIDAKMVALEEEGEEEAEAEDPAWDYETVTGLFEMAEKTVEVWEGEEVEAGENGEKTAFLEDEETGEKSDEWTIDENLYKLAKEVVEEHKVDPSDYGVYVPGLTSLITDGLDAIGASDTIKSLVVDGAWGGVATVLGFVPVITIVFLFLAFLEGCGYMSRLAFVMDRLFRKFGLPGRSFIPMLVGKGCGVPAIMAARAIESQRDQRLTIMLATFIPCSAKTVIIALFSVVFFREMWYVAPLMDVTGIALIVLGGIALKKAKAFSGEAAPFIMELPAYHIPTLRAILTLTWNRVKGYIMKAGLIIFPACVFLWFISHFDWTFTLLEEEQIDQSILRDLGYCIQWLFKPLGFGTWQGAAATVSAEIAKEQAVATLGVLAQGAEITAETSGGRIFQLFGQFSDFPRLAALSFMMFNLFIPPCMVAIGVAFRELVQAKWGWFAIGFQLFVGYVLAMSTYQIGCLVAGGGFSLWLIPTFLVDALALWLIFRPAPKKPAEML